MNGQAQIRKMQTCISQPQRERGVFRHADRERALSIASSTPSPGSRSFAWQDSGNDADHGEHGSPTLCFCSQESGRLRNMVSLLSGGMGILRSMPSRQVFPSSANSPVFSLLTSGHSLGACPAPGGASMFCFKPFGSGFPATNFSRKERARKFLAGASAESTSRPWERGTSRRFAQECPEEVPGKNQHGGNHHGT